MEYGPTEPISGKLDYFRMTFKRHDIEHFLETVVRIKKAYFYNDASSKFGYAELFQLDQIRVYNSSPTDDRGIMIELGGQGCRQLEGILQAQGRDWFSFLEQCLQEGGKITRLDIAMDDRHGYLVIPEIMMQAQLGYIDSHFRAYDFHGSGNLSTGAVEGVTLYFGSKKSAVYIAMYQKDHEQAKKLNVDVEDIGFWNRYEIRLRDERADTALRKLLETRNFIFLSKGILMEYLRFEEKSVPTGKRKWQQTKKGWEQLLQDTSALKLTSAPETAFYRKTEYWLKSQVSASMKLVQMADEILGKDSTLETMIEEAVLSDKHKAMLKVLTADVQDMIFVA